jgi:methyl-accepting chemotaxis protein
MIRSQIFSAIIMIVISIVVLGFVLRYLLQGLITVSKALHDISKGQGDLTSRIPVRSKDEVGKLAQSFNQFVDRMHSTITTIFELSQNVKDQSEQSAKTAQEREALSKKQLDETTMVATALTEMTSSTGEIAKNAEQTAFKSQEAVDVTQKGRALSDKELESITNLSSELENASRVIEDLNQQSSEINDIVSSIKGIAEQVNLLALNAAIEAARAGEQGRGFAVVADEVRVLSQRTRASTVDIHNVISKLQDTTGDAVKAMQLCHDIASTSVEDTQNGASGFSEIQSSVVEINDMAIHISTAAEEQAAVTSELNRNTETIKNIANQIQSDATESHSQAKQLNSLSQELAEQVSIFKI